MKKCAVEIRFNNKYVEIRTVEFQWLEHRSFGTMKICSRQGFELMSVNHIARSGGIIGLFFSIFFYVKVCCVFSLESPH